MIGFINTLYTPLGITGNYCATANHHTLQFIAAKHKCPQSALVFTIRCQATDFKTGIITVSLSYTPKYRGTIAHVKSSLHSQTFNSTELHSIILMPQFLNSTPVIPASYPGSLACRNSTDLNGLLSHFSNSSARTSLKTSSSIVIWILRGKVFTQLFHSNGCTRHISYRDNSCIVACDHYLATAVSLAPQFLLWANTPQSDGGQELGKDWKRGRRDLFPKHILELSWIMKKMWLEPYCFVN
jgi:hypothetical protein